MRPDITILTRKIYSENVIREWRRLTKDPFHRLEFETTLRFLKKYLPENGLILDAGGGPGRYSIYLAKMGYDIVLLDLVPAHLEFAKRKIKKEKIQDRTKDIVEGSITDLSKFDSNSFDAVLCLGGVLSHIHPESERKLAAFELARVAKQNAPVFVSVMGKLGTLTRFHKWTNEVRDTQHFRKFYLRGDDYQWHSGKAYAHFFELEELKSLFSQQLELLEEVGLEGLATPCQEKINVLAKKDPIAWSNWKEMHNNLCTNRTVVEFSLHFMVIGKKRAPADCPME